MNRSRGTVVGSRVFVADSWASRTRGYLGRPEPAEGEGILLVPCNAIHTYGMKFPIDALFVSSEGRVLETAERLEPWKGPRRVRGARYVLEVPAGTIEASRTKKGDGLAWMGPRPGAVGPGGVDPTETADFAAYADARRKG